METTAERIKAVDHAAAMVEEMLKQATVNSGVKVNLILRDIGSCIIENFVTNLMISVPQVDHLLNTRIFLGFEVDPLVNIVSRIRGPNVSFSFIRLSRFFLASSFVFHLVPL